MASSPEAAIGFTNHSWLLEEHQSRLSEITADDIQSAKNACAEKRILEVPPTYELVVQLPPIIGSDPRLVLLEKYLALRHKLAVSKNKSIAAENALAFFSDNPSDRAEINTNWDITAVVRLADLADLLFEDVLESVIFAIAPDTAEIVKYGFFRFGVIACQYKGGRIEELRLRSAVCKHPYHHTTAYTPDFE